MVLQVSVTILMKKVGYHSISRVTTETMTAIYTAIFFNTGIILLIADANFTYVPYLGFIPLHGLYPDFGYPWYVSIAPSLI